MKLRRILLLGMLGFSLALSAENKKIGYVQVSPDSSLADAVRKAREMRRLGQADSVVVKMQAGQYRLYEPLVLRPEDSHLCFEGTPSVKHSAGTVLTGAVPVTGWKKQGRYLVADVPDFNQMPRIRWVDKKKRVIWVPASAVRQLLTGAKDKAGNSIIRPDARYAEMTLHQMWEVSYLRIRNIRIQGDSAAISFHDPEAKIQFERPWPSPMYNCEHNSPFFISNALPLLDKPGEWYHDIRTHKLYYMPRKGERMDVAAPALETLVKFEGTREKWWMLLLSEM